MLSCSTVVKDSIMGSQCCAKSAEVGEPKIARATRKTST